MKGNLGLTNLAMLPSYNYIFVHLRQKARLRPELSPKLLSTLGPNSTRKARPDLQFCYCRPKENERQTGNGAAKKQQLS